MAGQLYSVCPEDKTGKQCLCISTCVTGKQGMCTHKHQNTRTAEAERVFSGLLRRCPKPYANTTSVLGNAFCGCAILIALLGDGLF